MVVWIVFRLNVARDVIALLKRLDLKITTHVSLNCFKLVPSSQDVNQIFNDDDMICYRYSK